MSTKKVSPLVYEKSIRADRKRMYKRFIPRAKRRIEFYKNALTSSDFKRLKE